MPPFCFSTPTFLRTFLKRCEKEQFHKLESRRSSVRKNCPSNWPKRSAEKFGVLPQEGYGTTETSGPASVNVPDHRSEMVEQQGTKLGTVGRPLPTVVVKDRRSGNSSADSRRNTKELSRSKGATSLPGYLNCPEKTAAVAQRRLVRRPVIWGCSMTTACLTITGRLSRFSKIGGEMVPHIKIEECLLPASSGHQDGDDGRPILAVTAVPEDKKGERLIVLHRRAVEADSADPG